MILAIKTAGQDTELYLATADGQIKRQLQWESRRELADKLLIKINKLLAQADLKTTDLEGIAVFSGPGSFTSLRIGHTVANALADGLGVAVVGTMGEDWLKQGATQAAGQPSGPALPHYGSEAHITKPKS
ncbi:MAG TPA: tRNA (adenosine(37)-N6)-threonylcarbamoyltransferase complex dimerization subunit type 1 TsaB [Candidatus Saccharimonadia bacterium]|jgi:tRNA threonylcarbamoyladenosine biosynthesis protein TsaB